MRYSKSENYRAEHYAKKIKVEPGIFVIENTERFQNVYKLAQSLGSGIYGQVKTCFHKETGQKRAVKIFQKNLTNSNDEKLQLLKEISILKELDHPNIIRMYEFFEDVSRLYLVMEYCSGGELFTEILKRQSFSEKEAAKIFHQLLSAISYLHSEGIIHGDINPENILLEDKNEYLNVKLADFGSSIIKSEICIGRVNISKPYYAAPETYEGINNEESDLWSCGVILYILLCGHPPFDGENDEQIIALAKRARVKMDGIIWNKISPEVKDLINHLLCFASNRIDASDALKHPWFNKFMYSDIPQENISDSIANLRGFHAPNKLKDAIITFITSQFYTFKQTKEIRQIFLSLDKDGDGRISREELVDQLSRLYEQTEVEFEKEIDHIMRQVDTNNSGYIEYTEFVKINFDSTQLLSDQILKTAFALFDRDGDGAISVEEIKKLFPGEGKDDENVWTSIISAIDVDGDKKIDIEELKALVKSNLIIYSSYSVLF